MSNPKKWLAVSLPFFFAACSSPGSVHRRREYCKQVSIYNCVATIILRTILPLLFLLISPNIAAADEAITNGSFSSGTSGWTLSGDFWAGVNSSYTSYRTSPGYAAGGVDSAGQAKNGASGLIYQTVTIPSGATAATLLFFLNTTSNETSSTPYDHLYLEILNSGGGLLGTLASYSNLDKGSIGAYTQKSFSLN